MTSAQSQATKFKAQLIMVINGLIGGLPVNDNGDE